MNTTTLLIIGQVAIVLIIVAYRTIKLAIRASILKKNGYPPPHCDVLGDKYIETELDKAERA